MKTAKLSSRRNGSPAARCAGMRRVGIVVGSRAFSIVELLTVMAIVAVLASAAIPATISGFRHLRVTQTGNLLADLAAQASQAAMNKNVITAIVFAPDNQAATVAEFGPTRQWRLLAPWTQLPENVQVELRDQPALPPGTGSARLSFRGTDLTLTDGYAFFPSGRLAPGSNGDPGLRVTAPNSDPDANFYDVILSPESTGHTVVRR